MFTIFAITNIFPTLMNIMGLFQFPASVLLAITYVLLIWLVYRFVGGTFVRAMAGWKAGAISMAAVAAFMAVEGTWAIDLHHSIPFIAAVLMLQLCLGLTILTRIHAGLKNNLRANCFVITHLGMFLLVWASFWGSPDVTRARIIVFPDQASDMAIGEDGSSVSLPFSLQLEDFIIDTYPDGTSPRQYTGVLKVQDLVSGTGPSMMSTSVNKPCSYKGYRLYQAGFDPEGGEYSVILAVKDPWLPLVYLGMLMLFAGSAVLLSGRWKLKVLIPAVLVLAIIFTAATVARISFGTLPPALRSVWFVPHIMVYMVAYSAMAISVVLALVDIIRRRRCPGADSKAGELSDSLMHSASVLLLAGMLCGCIWAKQAWGDYWSWDPKENWAAVTWLLTLIHIHIAPMKRKRAWTLLAVLLVTFLALQVTWYGVNYLPSTSHSMHTYNK